MRIFLLKVKLNIKKTLVMLYVNIKLSLVDYGSYFNFEQSEIEKKNNA